MWRRHHASGGGTARGLRWLAAAAVVLVVGASLAVVASSSSGGTPKALVPTALPADCAPSVSLASKVTSYRPPATPKSPLKDLGIQPATLTEPQWQALLAVAERAGVEVVNTGVAWPSLEPNGPNSRSSLWTTLHEFVSDAAKDHMAVRFQLTSFPQWARDPGDSSAPWLAPTKTNELGRWADWVRALIKSFGTSVSFYEVWNEENIRQFWPQGPNPANYAGLLACSYVAAKAVNPKVTIVSGGLSTNDIGYLQDLYLSLEDYPHAKQMSDFFDVLGVHPYSGGRSPSVNSAQYISPDEWGLDDTNFLGFERLHEVMAAHQEGWKRIYIGEYGTPVSGLPPGSEPGFESVSEQTRADWVSLAFSLAASSKEVLALSWYTFYPTPYDPEDWAIVLPAASSPTSTSQWLPTLGYRALASVPEASIAGLP